MNLIKRTVIAAGLFAMASASFAGVSYTNMASATIDWSGLTFTTIGLGGAAPGYSLTEGGDDASADNWFDSAWDAAPDWATGTSASVTSPDASAMTTADTLSATVTGEPGAYWTWADANRHGTVDITGGPGLLIVTVPYELDVTFDGTGALTSAYTWIELSNFASGTSSWGSADKGWWQDDDFVPGVSAGILSASLYVEDGDLIDIYASASAHVDSTVVPLPAAAWMFGAAILAFAGMASRKRV